MKEKYNAIDGLKAMSALMIVAAHIVFEPDYTLGSKNLMGGGDFFRSVGISVHDT